MKGFERLLRASGFDVYPFDSLHKFLDGLKPDISGCIVMEVNMPGVDGKVLLAELKDRNANLPIIVVTADDTSETRKKAQNMKAVGFFRKPVDGTALVDTIEWTLKLRENRQY